MVASGEWTVGSGSVKQGGTLPLRCMGKSAEVIDEKEVAVAPLSKRVRNSMKRKEIDRVLTPRMSSGQERVRNRMKTKRMKEAADFANGRRSRKGLGYGGASGGEPYKIIAWNYDSVNTRISD
jgi:hypothetical protein